MFTLKRISKKNIAAKVIFKGTLFAKKLRNFFVDFL